MRSACPRWSAETRQSRRPPHRRCGDKLRTMPLVPPVRDMLKRLKSTQEQSKRCAASHTTAPMRGTSASTSWASASARPICPEASAGFWHRTACGTSASTTCATQAPASCWPATCPSSRFRNGWGTAISARPPTSTPTWTRNPRPARRTPCSAPWALKRREIRARNKKKAKQHMSLGRMWRRGWDSNPCAVSDKLISSQPRYDHFDTSPYISTAALPGKSERTTGENRIFNSSPQAPRGLVPSGFSFGSLPRWTHDFESVPL